MGQVLLAWAPRLPALLSLAGSLTILCAARKSPRTMYHQLMMSISAADVVSSISWFMSSWPIPPVGLDADIWGASGNFAACKAQGVLLIWSTTSHWLNVSLSLYYKLVIVNGWRERDFTKPIRVVMLSIPPIIGSGIAFLSYPYIVPSGVGCSFLPFPWETRGVLFYMLLVLPMCIVLFAVVALTLWVCWKFTQQMQVADKWRFSGRRRETSENQRGSVGTVRSTLSSWATSLSQHSLEGVYYDRVCFTCLPFAPLHLSF